MDNKSQKNLISLEKHRNTYKLIIPIEVERKIRHLCNKISQVEWSGTLFYTHSGTYEDNNLEIKCVDIFPMDIGSQAYTEFDMSPDVIAYMTDHPELLDCQTGLVHSHNNMATFISSTDAATLREEGNDRNHFVSLIVNNAGTYTAAITRKLTIKKVISSTFTYKTFDDIEKTGVSTSEVEEEVIEYNMLDIIKEGEVANPFLEVDERLEIIRKNKEKAKEDAKKNTKVLTSTYYNGLPFTPYSKKDDNLGSYVRQGRLFDDFGDYSYDEEYMDSAPLRKVEPLDPNDTSDDTITIDASTVKSITLQLITGSIAIADASRIDPVKWAGQMVKLFDTRFKNNMQLFDYWSETMVEFVVTNFVPEKYTAFEDNYIIELCEEVYKTLDKLPSNKYIKSIQNALAVWMK